MAGFPPDILANGRFQGAVAWRGRLERTHDTAELIRVVKDYLAEVSPEEIRCLPEACWPGRFVDAEDVARYAVELARAQLRPGQDASPLLDKLTQFFAAASARASQLLVSNPAESMG